MRDQVEKLTDVSAGCRLLEFDVVQSDRNIPTHRCSSTDGRRKFFLRFGRFVADYTTYIPEDDVLMVAGMEISGINFLCYSCNKQMHNLYFLQLYDIKTLKTSAGHSLQFSLFTLHGFVFTDTTGCGICPEYNIGYIIHCTLSLLLTSTVLVNKQKKISISLTYIKNYWQLDVNYVDIKH